MIGYLEGEVKFATKGKIILFCNGIGFTISIPSNISFLEKQKASLFIHTHLREDNLSLFGFQSPKDLELFEKLISVSGIGPKTALNMFSVASCENIEKAIIQSNIVFFTSIPGIGKKSSQKIILDLKSKLGKGELDLSKLEGDSELIDSLISLGFQKSEIITILPQMDQSQDITTQIKSALKLLNRK